MIILQSKMIVALHVLNIKSIPDQIPAASGAKLRINILMRQQMNVFHVQVLLNTSILQ